MHGPYFGVSWKKSKGLTFSWAASSDKVSGLAKYQLYIHDSVNQDDIPPDKTSIAPASPLLEGAYLWKVAAIDAAGNTKTSDSTFRFYVDSTPPETVISISEPKHILGGVTYVKSNTQFTLKADDGKGSGIALTEYKVDDGDWTPYSEPFTVLKEGEHTISYRSKDKVENVEDAKRLSIFVESLKPWDVNGDFVVDIFDLVIVGRHFGEAVEGPMAPNPDVNRDGVVNIFDLVLVGVHFGEDYRTIQAIAALSEIGVFSDETTRVRLVAQNKVRVQGARWLRVDITTEQVENLYGLQFDLLFDPQVLKVVDVKAGDALAQDGAQTYWSVSKIDNRKGRIYDVVYVRKATKKGINVRGSLASVIFEVKEVDLSDTTRLSLSNIKLADANARQIRSSTESAVLNWEALFVPVQSKLLSNYPNPFNPETWIPFQLADQADVLISIYNLRGQLICQINLGNLPACMYINRSRAAYWDGRNNKGERMPSGIYFYHMQAGDYNATKRMLILK
ncbi:MAG: OmpL47-type beta-barrel domain-containing protein [Candidatus Zixiibacteriota bacterium]